MIPLCAKVPGNRRSLGVRAGLERCFPQAAGGGFRAAAGCWAALRLDAALRPRPGNRRPLGRHALGRAAESRRAMLLTLGATLHGLPSLAGRGRGLTSHSFSPPPCLPHQKGRSLKATTLARGVGESFPCSFFSSPDLNTKQHQTTNGPSGS